MNFHPLADIFPLIDGQAYSDLIADIIKHGVREPVWLYEGQILDGRNRWRAAKVAGVECETREYEGDDPAGFVVSLNLHRRHLSESQRAMVAAKLASLPVGANQHAQICAPSQGDAADLLGVSRRSVQTARAVMDEGAPELIAAVERGDVAVSAAAQLATLPQDMQADIVATGPEEGIRWAGKWSAPKNPGGRLVDGVEAFRRRYVQANVLPFTPKPRDDEWVAAYEEAEHA